MGKGEIDDEIMKAERLIPGDTFSTVLFIACTNYENNLMEGFGGKGFQVYPTGTKLCEVILLNLTSPEIRAKFFGIGNPENIVGLETLIKKTQLKHRKVDLQIRQTAALSAIFGVIMNEEVYNKLCQP
jgi:hypothetical protein